MHRTVCVQESTKDGSQCSPGAHTGGGGEGGGYSLDSTRWSTCALELSLPPLFASLTHTQTHTHSAHVCRSVVKEVVCRWLLIGPQGPGGWVMGTPMRPFVYLRYKQCLWQR